MTVSAYGGLIQTKLGSELEKSLEEVEILGYTIIENAISQKGIEDMKSKALEIYERLEAEYGYDYLKDINELNMLRSPLVHDELFLKLAINDKAKELISALLGQNFSLHLQNAIINKPQEIHHQRSWHRDLPYQNYTTSKPIAISMLACIDEFTVENGATELLPYSHKLETMPSPEYCEKHMVTATAKPGSLICFNSLLIHRAGENKTNNIRLGVNHMYTVPLLKQQISLPDSLEGKYSDDPFLRKLLGYDYIVPKSDKEWKERHYKKKNAN